MIYSMMRFCPHLMTLTCLLPLTVAAQRLTFSHPHGFHGQPFSLAITMDDGQSVEACDVRYTLDGSRPNAASKRYTQPLTIKGTTILRAAVLAADTIGDVSTATYLFVADVLKQGNTPEGYPQKWGRYTTISGTAKADYEMDPEMTNDETLAKKIAEGLESLPVLSIVTDKDHLFSHEEDSLRGGIYIFTGPPVGDPTGHGWTRPASVELFGGPQQHDMSVDCGLRLHGGHGRLAEKNPKHSFRLVFKKQYGPATLDYPVFGSDEPAQFDQLVLRCHFGNSWQHWNDGGRQKAQYARDVWARRMQRKMGHTSVNALYVNLFINGMYWGLYNVAERVDDQFGKSHLGGKKSEIDVIKLEEDGGYHLEASEGDMEAWDLMVATAARAADNDYYMKLQGKRPDGTDDPQQEALLDIDHFIDYMLINQYAGNTDWDQHNWYAIRRKGAESKGFRILCWDSEQLFESRKEDVLGKNNRGFPTGIFNDLLRNEQFAVKYVRRAKEVLSEDGLLGRESVVELWDSLYHTIENAVYAEAARWGDYRRDVHRYTSPGQLYTVDEHFMAERRRLLEDYFPIRSQRVLDAIIDMVGIDFVETCIQTPPDDGNYYNLQGQRVAHPSKGVYIHRGRKVVIK
ncbi:MAG: CotH kinase family protein [Prevotella sp.]|nr:CotH kinase family protein [Prevotella sp.]